MLNPQRLERLEEAALLLAFGSLWLFAGWLLLTFVILVWIAIPFHLAAWWRLFKAVRTGFLRMASKQDRLLAMTFVLSIVGFVAGLSTIPLTVPSVTGYQLRVLVGYALFAYVPSVFAPVAIAHAVIFVISSVGFPRGTRKLSQLGSGILVALGFAGLAAQTATAIQGGTLWFPTIAFSGLTSFAYLPITFAVRSARIPRAFHRDVIPTWSLACVFAASALTFGSFFWHGSLLLWFVPVQAVVFTITGVLLAVRPGERLAWGVAVVWNAVSGIIVFALLVRPWPFVAELLVSPFSLGFAGFAIGLVGGLLALKRRPRQAVMESGQSS